MIIDILSLLAIIIWMLILAFIINHIRHHIAINSINFQSHYQLDKAFEPEASNFLKFIRTRLTIWFNIRDYYLNKINN